MHLLQGVLRVPPSLGKAHAVVDGTLAAELQMAQLALAAAEQENASLNRKRHEAASQRVEP